MACALVPAIAGSALHPLLSVSVFIAAFVIALVAGYPTYALLRRFSLANGWTATMAGLVIGGGFQAYSSWPLQYSELKGTSFRGSCANIVYTMIDGVPTQVMWNEYYLSCAIFGLAGAVAGWVFWYQMSKPLDSQPEPRNDDWKLSP
jgi:hypothetical protein